MAGYHKDIRVSTDHPSGWHVEKPTWLQIVSPAESDFPMPAGQIETLAVKIAPGITHDSFDPKNNKFYIVAGNLRKEISVYWEQGEEPLLDVKLPRLVICARNATTFVPYERGGDIVSVHFDPPAGWTITDGDDGHGNPRLQIQAPPVETTTDIETMMIVTDTHGRELSYTLRLVCGAAPVAGSSTITITGFNTNLITVHYMDGGQETVVIDTESKKFHVANSKRIIHSIDVPDAEGTPFLTGRAADGSAITLVLDKDGYFTFRPAVGNYIPVGTYLGLVMIKNSANLSKKFKQDADLHLDVDSREWVPIGTATTKFTGEFDGGNHKIHGLKVTGNKDYVGLFGYNAGMIKNVHVASGAVTGKDYVGGVCGYAEYAISGCNNEGSTITGNNYVGGVCGYLTSTISRCNQAGNVTGKGDYVGGVCGYSTGTITKCNNEGGTITGRDHVSGVCGYSTNIITECHNKAAITGNDHTGGLCGTFYSKDRSGSPAPHYFLKGCHNTGRVESTGGNSGGVCGTIQFSKYGEGTPGVHEQMVACHNEGEVLGSNAGGLCGDVHVTATGVSGSHGQSYFYITACYNKGKVSGSKAGGLCGDVNVAGSTLDYAYFYLTACYNTGPVTGNPAKALCGSITQGPPSNTAFTAAGNFWREGSADEAGCDGLKFETDWPSTTIHAQWGIGNGSGDNKYWKSMGQLPNHYPKLYFED
jgi:hypothetical protein